MNWSSMSGTRKAKRFRPLAALGIGACLVLVAGCGSSSSPSAAPLTKLVVYNSDSANTKALQAAVKPFETANHVTVQIIDLPFVTSEDQFLNQLPTLARAGLQMDVLLPNGQDVRTLKADGLISSLDGVVDPKTLIPAATQPFTLNNTLYAAGMEVAYTSGITYNKDLMTKYNLIPPDTFDAVQTDVAKLKGTGVSLLAPAGGDISLWSMWLMQLLQQASNNDPQGLTDKTLSGQMPFTDPTYIRALTWFQQLAGSGAFIPGFNGLSETSAVSEVLHQKAAMFYGGTWDTSTIATSAKFGVGMTPFPTFSSVISAPVGGVGLAAAIYAHVDPTRKAMAQKLVQYLVSSDGSKAILEAGKDAFWPLPTAKNTEVAGTGPSAALLPVLREQYLPTTFTFLDWYWPKEVTAAATQQLQSLAGGRTTPEAVAQALADAYTAAKKNGWTFYPANS